MSYELVFHIPHNPITKIPTGSGGWVLIFITGWGLKPRNVFIEVLIKRLKEVSLFYFTFENLSNRLCG
jgi:hypothetical protein